MPARTIFTAFMFHLVASGMWVLGFGFCLTAFGSGGLVGIGRFLFLIHSVMMSPIILMEYYVFSITYIGLLDKKDSLLATVYDGSIGPFPSIASVIWSLIVGYVLCWLSSKSKRKQQTEQVAAPDGE